MKKLKKFISVMLISLLALIPAAVCAEAVVNNDDIQGLIEILGIKDLSPEAIKELIDKLASGDLNIFGASGKTILSLIEELQKYIAAFEPENTTAEDKPDPETTGTPETTQPETTSERPTTIYPYIPPEPETPVYYEDTTQPATTFPYIPPEPVYTQPLTTVAFNPKIDDSNTGEDSNAAKTAVGAVLLTLAGLGVIFVAIKLRKTNI